MKKWSFLFAALFISALLFQSCKKDRNDKPCNNNNNNSKQTNSVIDNQAFVNQASSSNQFEISAGQLAVTKGQSQAVKDFGTHMLADHTKANTELLSLTTPKGWPIPKDVLAQEQANLNLLKTATGRQFDEEFARLMVESHQKAVNLFVSAAQTQGGTLDTDLRNWVVQKLPALRAHLEKAKALQNQVNQNKQ